MTYIELIQLGCCEEGVLNFVRKTGIFKAQITPDFLQFVKERVEENDWETLLFAVGLDGFGYGKGFGYGDGDGFGFVDGYGDGDGYGKGYGFVDGYGFINGFVDGNGYGDGKGKF